MSTTIPPDISPGTTKVGPKLRSWPWQAAALAHDTALRALEEAR